MAGAASLGGGSHSGIMILACVGVDVLGGVNVMSMVGRGRWGLPSWRAGRLQEGITISEYPGKPLEGLNQDNKMVGFLPLKSLWMYESKREESARPTSWLLSAG